MSLRSKTSSGQSPILLLCFLFAGGLINYMDRAVIGLLGPTMRSDLSLSPGHFGIAMSAFSVGYTVFTLVGGWATDRFGSTRVLLATMLVWSIFAALTGAVTSLFALIVVRFLFGAGEAPWLSAFNKLLTDRVPRERFSTFHSLCSCGQPLGGAIAGPLMGAVTAIYGWRAGFLTVGAIGMLWAILWIALVAGRGDHAKGTAEAKLVAAPASEPEARISRRTVMRDVVIWACIFNMACATYLLVFFFSWFPSYLTATFSLGKRELGLVSALPWLVGMVCYAVGGMLSDWLATRLGSLLRARRLMIMACLTGSGLLTMIVPFGHSLTAALILMSAAMGLMYLTGSMYFAIGLSATPKYLVGFVSGVFLFVSNISASVSPVLSGYLIQWTGSYASSFFVAGALGLAAAFTAWRVIQPPARAAKETADTTSPLLEGSLP
jgi:ACS family hexuronate transporter-like MFS transporter